MQPFLGPLPEHAPDAVVRKVAYVSSIEEVATGIVLAHCIIFGVGVIVDLAGRSLAAGQWALLDLAEPEAPTWDKPRRLALVDVVDTCPTSAPEWAARRRPAGDR